MITSPPFFNAMTLIAFILGLAVGFGWHLRRTRELRRAFLAACEQLHVARTRIEVQQRAFLKIQAMLTRSQSKRNSTLDGRALPPAAADRAGRRSDFHSLNRISSGPSKGGSDF